MIDINFFMTMKEQFVQCSCQVDRKLYKVCEDYHISGRGYGRKVKSMI